jgi:hypothetical protein
MKKIILTILLFGMVATQAHEKKKKHRHHEAHVHGAANLNIAFDQLNGKIDFKAASEGILGFEHQPKTDLEKKKLADAISSFDTGMASMIKFDPALGCVLTKEKIEMVAEEKEAHKAEAEKNHDKHHGEHSDFIAQFNVACKSDIKGSQLTIDFTQFKSLKDVDVTLLIGDLQKSMEVKRKPVIIDLK